MNYMNILYTCDNNYVWLMGISMLSLFENNKTVKEITVYLLGESISDDSKSTLQAIANCYQRKCIVIDMPSIDIPKSLISTRWPKSAFSRLYAAELLPEYVKKVLYLDCDTVILQSLKELEKMNTNDYFVYGVKDCIGTTYRKNLGLDKDSIYINAGVLYLNLNLLRTINVSAMIDSFLKKYGKTIHYADQDVLNGMFSGKFGVLSAEYDVMTLEYMHSYKNILILRQPVNYYSKSEIEYAISNPKILHFTTNMLNVRPWYLNTNHPMAKEFIKYKNMSPWRDKVLTNMIHDSGLKATILKKLQFLPQSVETEILGFIHAIAYPLVIRMKARIKH